MSEFKAEPGFLQPKGKNKKSAGRYGKLSLQGSNALTLSTPLSMDILPEHDPLVAETAPILSYDQDVAYEDQVEVEPTQPSLADRIGRSKVYLLSESSVTRGSKVRVSQYR